MVIIIKDEHQSEISVLEKYPFIFILSPKKISTRPSHLQRPNDAKTNALHSLPGGRTYCFLYVTTEPKNNQEAV